MTTLISSPENSALVSPQSEVRLADARGYVTYRIRHTLASRFAFLIICLAIILSALAYGTVHAWSLAIFFIGSLVLLVLWVVDNWNLGAVRISRNVLQIPLLGLIALGLIQLLPLRTPETVAGIALPLVRSLSFDPYATRFIVIEVVALLIYFAATRCLWIRRNVCACS